MKVIFNNEQQLSIKLSRYVFIGIVSLLAIVSILALLNTPANALTVFTHRHLYDDVFGNQAGWNPDGNAKLFGIIDSKFDPVESIVLINTVNYVKPGVVCHVDHRSYGSFEVNCGEESDAPAPEDGTELHYLIITTPFSDSNQIFTPATGGVISLRENMTGSMDVENQTLGGNTNTGGIQ